MQDKIIHFLKESQGYLSGEEICRPLKISRAAIWKNIEELRKEGYEIVAVPHLGYKLVSCPDKLLAREIQFDLNTKILGKRVVQLESINSTMDEAFNLGLKGADEGTVVCAEAQSKGRGRLGRSWNSPKGKGIYMSVILRPQLAPTDAAQITLLCAVALSDAIQKVSGLQPMIKWPNDLLINNKKVAGILTEMNAEMDCVRFMVIGMGINVNTPLNLLPPNSTSLKSELKQEISRVRLVQEILRQLEHWYESLKRQGFAPVIKKWKQLSSTLGKRVQIGELQGEAVDLDEFGGLIIRNDQGVSVQRMTGDVVQIR